MLKIIIILNVSELWLIIVDEIHYFKNRKSRRYSYLQEIINGNPKARRVFLSATPINNTGDDYQSIVKLIGGKHLSTNTTKRHETMLNSAPDILMTNYKMLDYLLVRPKDAMLWQDNDSETLKYIAVDELHTFDGAQGTDLVCLLRRLKRRLGIYDGFLCCIGTSATMGAKENNSSIVEYASEIFGEPFEKDSVITEDRLSAAEFFEDSPITQFEMPSSADVDVLNQLSEDDEPSEYLKKAVSAWFPEFALDVLSDEGRIELGKELMNHSFMQAVVSFTGGNYYQASGIIDELSIQYPQLKENSDPVALVNSLFALVSHARSGEPGKLRPFLFVQVQLWMRELRRLVAKVDPKEITYEIAYAKYFVRLLFSQRR